MRICRQWAPLLHGSGLSGLLREEVRPQAQAGAVRPGEAQLILAP